MARVTGNPALALRTRAREAIFAAGGRGFVRFLPEGGALLVTDAARRTDAAQIEAALIRAGFDCAQEREGLIAFSPSDAAITALTDGPAPQLEIDWEGPLHPAQALADRFLRRERAVLTDDGRQLILETLRAGYLPAERLGEGMDILRARAAAMLRGGDISGMTEAGRLLAMMLMTHEEQTDGRVSE